MIAISLPAGRRVVNYVTGGGGYVLRHASANVTRLSGDRDQLQLLLVNAACKSTD